VCEILKIILQKKLWTLTHEIRAWGENSSSKKIMIFSCVKTLKFSRFRAWIFLNSSLIFIYFGQRSTLWHRHQGANFRLEQHHVFLKLFSRNRVAIFKYIKFQPLELYDHPGGTLSDYPAKLYFFTVEVGQGSRIWNFLPRFFDNYWNICSEITWFEQWTSCNILLQIKLSTTVKSIS